MTDQYGERVEIVQQFSPDEVIVRAPWSRKAGCDGRDEKWYVLRVDQLRSDSPGEVEKRIAAYWERPARFNIVRWALVSFLGPSFIIPFLAHFLHINYKPLVVVLCGTIGVLWWTYMRKPKTLLPPDWEYRAECIRKGRHDSPWGSAL